MRRLQTILPLALLAGAFTLIAGVRTADAALRHGRPPMSSGDTKGVNILGEAQFECGTYKGNQVEHAWRKAVDEHVQKEVRANKRMVQGGLDYRIPAEQGLATFTALQRRGVESKFLFFPDENHWVLKPLNSIQWHDTVNGWLQQHIGSEPR